MPAQDPPPGAHVTYSRQYRRCSKPACPSCAAGAPGHGPYWYAYWREDGRQRSRYLGKDAPPGAQGQGPVAAAPVAAPAAPSAPGGLRVRTLGGLAVWQGGTDLRIATARPRAAAALLACLLSAPGHRLRRGDLAELLWPEGEPGAGQGKLRVAAHHLRRLLGAGGADLRQEGAFLCLGPLPAAHRGGEWLDADAFEAAARAALAGHDAAACHAALALYGGDYLPDFPHADWALARREALADLHLGLLEHLAALAERAGASEEAAECLRRALESDPCREPAARALIRLETAAGRHDGAVRVYRDLAETLRREMGLAPDQETEALYRAALEGRLRAARARTNLPTPSTSFVGRDAELAALEGLLGVVGEDGGAGVRPRLVSLLGPGGVGKTRLALEAARAVLPAYPDGVWLVELAALPASAEADPLPVARQAAATLGLREEGDRDAPAALLAHLGPRRALLLLDNCEHLLGACAAVVGALLEGCPDLRILATSREGLGLAAEEVWRLGPLAAPGPVEAAGLTLRQLVGRGAVRLLVERGRAARSGFALTEANRTAVAVVCARLDGLPLALELAAARLAHLSVGDLAARLEDRLGLLAGRDRGAPPRHRTLRGVLDWSHGLLGAGEQALFRRLAVFAGGWPLAAAEAVCGDGETPAASARVAGVPVLDLLGGLVNRSLVHVEHADDGPMRYRLLETVRDFAHERLEAAGELESVRARHAAWCLALAEEAAPRLRGAEERHWLGRLAAEHDNLRAALGWARARAESELGLRLVAALWRYWTLQGQLGEGRGWVEAMLALPGPAETSARAQALGAGGQLAYRQGDYARAVALYEESLALCRRLGDTRGIAQALGHLGRVAHLRGDYAAARALNEESLALARALGDGPIIATALQRLGYAALEEGEYGRSQALGEESLALFRRSGDSYGTAGSLTMLGILAELQGRYTVAGALYEESLALNRALGDRYGVASALENLGFALIRQGDPARALAQFEECLGLFREMGDKHSIAITIGGLGLIADLRGDYQRAESLHEESLALNRELGNRHGVAVSLGNQGDVAFRRGDYERARTLHEEGLAISRDLGVRGQVAEGLESLAWIAAARAQPHLAARLAGAADALRVALGVPLLPHRQSGHDAALEAARAALGDRAFGASWAQGRTMPLEDAVAPVRAADPDSADAPAPAANRRT